jgi:hypothetical protein
MFNFSKKYPLLTYKDFKAEALESNEIEITFLRDVSAKKGEKILLSINFDPITIRDGVIHDGNNV